MKYQANICCTFLGALTLLAASCSTIQKTIKSTTLQGSYDEASTIEKGQSQIKYDPKTGGNLVLYSIYAPDADLFYDEEDAIPIDSYNETGYDPMPKTATPDKGSLGVRLGLEYVGKGAKFPDGGGEIKMDDLEIPLNLLYIHRLGPGIIHGGLGPFFAYGIGGTPELYGADNDGFKRFDAGINFVAGYEWKGITLDLGYDLGLANIEYPTNDVTGHSRCFSINIGYRIGRFFGR
ncbi:MAG TPA: outer membrane beta-barrel protein [Puia sp.]|nr:outer membrane beta-barrel protein [Puia sp.]